MSGLNCKPGDLAVLVRAHLSENLGLICRVIGPSSFGPGWWHVEFSKAIRWISGPRCLSHVGECQDSNLRPIRDQPGEDEMLRIAGNPQDQREPA